MQVEKNLQHAGIRIPQMSLPVANYTPGLRSGNYVYVSGQLPTEEGKLAYAGKVGADVSPEDGYAAARLCAINGLAVLKSLLGDLDRVERIVKIVGFVNSAPDFCGQPQVVNGASDLLAAAFGEKGVHARSAIGAASLPLGAAVEVELIVEVSSDAYVQG